MTRHHFNNNSILQRLLTRDRVTNDSLEGIRLLAETVRIATTPNLEYLRVLNQRTRVLKEKALRVSSPSRVAPSPIFRVRKRIRREADGA